MKSTKVQNPWRLGIAKVSEISSIALCSQSRSCLCNVCSIVSEALVVFLRSQSLLRQAEIWSYVSAALVLYLRSLSCSVLKNFSSSVSSTFYRLLFGNMLRFPFCQKGMPTYANCQSSMYILLCHTADILSSGIYRSPSVSPLCIQRAECTSADCLLKKVFSPETTRGLLERCPHKKNETLAAQRCYLRRKMCETCQCNTRMRLFHAS